ncbi:MAG: TonB-dependent receptor [Bdellovibrionota bacterium]
MNREISRALSLLAASACLFSASNSYTFAQDQGTPTGPPPETSRPSDLLSMYSGTKKVRLIDISLDALLAAGWSTEENPSIEELQGGGHDPKRRGFTLQQAELSLTGAVDPYVRGEGHIILFIEDGETIIELEEAFLTSQQLPWGLQVKAGQFFTEFGRTNPLHPHAWHWQDQPLILSRLFGPDGQRGPGARVSWLIPVPWSSELVLSTQNANGETMVSFLGEEEEGAGVGGRDNVNARVKDLGDLVYLARLVNAGDLTDDVSVQLGLSGLAGPNGTSENTRTWIYGADLVLKWRPGGAKGWPFFILEGEFAGRSYESAAVASPVVPEETLHDYGFYAQGLWGFHTGWAAGFRYEYATGKEEGVDTLGGTVVPRSEDPFRDNRHRLSPILVWHPSEFLRLRLQYNFDRAAHLALSAPSGKNAHSVWTGVEFLIGSHPPHQY